VIDLSADLGEGSPGEDHIWPLIHSANVACGGHTGDVMSMREAARRAREYGVKLGAHPSYPDRDNFGRESLDLARSDLLVSLVEQIRSLIVIAHAEGVAVVHVKLHGALYNDAHRRAELAETIVEAMRAADASLALVCADASKMAIAARSAGTPVIREAFADRRYAADGSLVPRKEPGSLLSITEAADQAARLAATGTVIARGGTALALPFDTICIHADMDEAVRRLQTIRSRLGIS
jgi:UPF0271 protein